MALTTRYVSSAGTDTYANSTNPSTPMSLTTAFANAAAGDLIMVKADGTYTRSASDTPTNVGTVTSPIIYRGYSSTITDGFQGRTNGNGPLILTNMPTIAYGSTFSLLANAKNYLIFESLNITGAVGSSLLRSSASGFVVRCNVVNSINNGNAGAITIPAQSVGYDCDAATTGASSQEAFQVALGGRLIGGRAKSTGFAVNLAGGVVAFVTCYDSAYGILCGTSGGTIINPTFQNITNEIVQTATTVSGPANIPLIVNGMATDSGKFINNRLTAVTAIPFFTANNRTRDNGASVAFPGDWPVWDEITTDAGGAETDYVDTATDDFRLIGTSPGKAAGNPSYLDCGALQRQESGGATPATLNGGIHQ